MNRLLTVDEVADILQRRPEWVADQCRSAAIRAVKVGMSWRIEQSAVQDYLDANRNRDPLALTPLSAKRQASRRAS